MEQFLAEYGLSGGMAGNVIFFFILALIGIGLGFLIGRYRLVALLASIYFSLAIFSAIPNTSLPKEPIFVVAIFSLLVLLLTFLDEYLFDVSADISESIWKSVVVGFFAVGAFVSVATSIVGYGAVSDLLSKQTFAYLAGPWANLFWLVAPLVFFFAVKKWGR